MPATPAQIQTALADAQANNLSYAHKAILLSAAIDQSLVNGSGEVSLPWTSTGSDGTTITRMSLNDAVTLLARLRSMQYGGIVGQYVEFQNPPGVVV
jgi:hypothetical protein